jgi:hypothetical protein
MRRVGSVDRRGRGQMHPRALGATRGSAVLCAAAVALLLAGVGAQVRRGA